MDWSSVFDETSPDPGASDAEIAEFLATVGQPLTIDEISEIIHFQRSLFHEGHPLHGTCPFDPSLWVMPTRPFPQSYLSFLRWSNGGWCRSGEREFGFFPTNHPTGGVRVMALAYLLPEYMPGALPFAFNGGGTFYLFDMRQDAVNGEYPIVCSHSGNQGWKENEHWFVAGSLEECCRGKIDVDDLRWGNEDVGRPEPPERVDAILIRVPKGGVRQLRSACNRLEVLIPISELPAIIKKAPYRICHNVPYLPWARLVVEANADDPCLGVFAVDDRNQPISLPPWEWK